MNERMPVLFVGHGSPLNAIGDNPYRRTWMEKGRELGKPPVIIAVSSHWYGSGLKIRTEEKNKQINDMYGFPKELYEVEYEPDNDVELANRIIEEFGSDITVDNTWGIDHGVWSVLSNMYSDADVPVVMMSIDYNKSPQEQYEVGQKLKKFRDEGAMIICSGNIVHNLMLVNWDMEDGYSWAIDFDDYIKDRIVNKDYQSVIDYQNSGQDWERSFKTPDHFNPILVALGSTYEDDEIEVWNYKCELGALSMTSYTFK